MKANFSLDDVCETIQSIPANIAVFRAEPNDRFVIQSMNPALESLYGAGPGEGVGVEVDEFMFVEDTRRRLKNTFMKCRDMGMEVTLEEAIPIQNGSLVQTSRTVTPVYDAKGKVIAVISTVTDNTELVNSRRTLLQTLSHAVSGFVTICSWCRKIREDDEWIPLENYVSYLSDADEALCPACRPVGDTHNLTT